MTGEEFQKKLDAIDKMTLHIVERHDRLLALILQYIKDVEEEWNPCETDSATSSLDSLT